MRLYQTTDELPVGGRILGFTDIFSDGTYLVSLTKSADFKTAIHEYGHVLRRNLTNQQLRVAGEFSMGQRYLMLYLIKTYGLGKQKKLLLTPLKLISLLDTQRLMS